MLKLPFGAFVIRGEQFDPNSFPWKTTSYTSSIIQLLSKKLPHCATDLCRLEDDAQGIY